MANILLALQDKGLQEGTIRLLESDSHKVLIAEDPLVLIPDAVVFNCTVAVVEGDSKGKEIADCLLQAISAIKIIAYSVLPVPWAMINVPKSDPPKLLEAIRNLSG